MANTAAKPRIRRSGIGAILLEQNAISEAMEVIRTADVFYVDANQRIWRAMASLYHENKQIDTLTVTERLKRHENLEAAEVFIT